MQRKQAVKSAAWPVSIARIAVLAGYASTEQDSPSAKPVLYPNAAPTRAG